MKKQILDLLYESNLWTHELSKQLDVEGGQVLRWLCELSGDGLVRRLQSGVWALDELDRRRRRNHGEYAERKRIMQQGNVKRDTSPFPRPGYRTPTVGLWG